MDDFIHIPKTAGSSIRTILARQYGVSAIANFEPGSHSLRGRDPVQVLKGELKERDIKLVTGHHAFGLHTSIYKELRYFSMVRDPISRAASEFYFAYSYEHHRLRNEILSGALTPESYLIDGRHSAPFDVQCRLLSAHRSEGMDPTALAVETITQCFSAIGVSELFDESLLLIAKRLGWRPPLYAVRNVTQLAPEILAARRRVEERVRTYHSVQYAADNALHKAMTAQLRRDIAAEGATFSNALIAFRELQDVMRRTESGAIFDRYEFAGTDRLPDLPPYILGSEAYRTVLDYLASPSATLRPRNYVGHVDVVRDRVVSGWAADLFSHRPIEITVRRGKKQIGSAIAENARADVARVCAIRPDVGFVAHLDEDISANGSDIRVYFGRTSLSI